MSYRLRGFGDVDCSSYSIPPSALQAIANSAPGIAASQGMSLSDWLLMMYPASNTGGYGTPVRSQNEASCWINGILAAAGQGGSILPGSIHFKDDAGFSNGQPIPGFVAPSTTPATAAQIAASSPQAVPLAYQPFSGEGSGFLPLGGPAYVRSYVPVPGFLDQGPPPPSGSFVALPDPQVYTSSAPAIPPATPMQQGGVMLPDPNAIVTPGSVPGTTLVSASGASPAGSTPASTSWWSSIPWWGWLGGGVLALAMFGGGE